MLNKEVYLKTSAEVCSQVASYFDVVDNCIATADTNKQYTVSPQTSYSPSPPIKQGSYTSVIISPNTHNTADIYNGFIRVNMKCTFEMSSAIDSTSNFGTERFPYRFDKLWFGFKDARDAVEKYEIVANGITIYTQNFACEESFLTGCCSNEVSKRADVYSKARHKDVFRHKFGYRCGKCVNLDNDASGKFTLNLKIDLRRFLPLSNIKYLPAFAGKIELRLYFSCAGMVYCPVGLDDQIINNPQHISKVTCDPITNEFTQIGDPIRLWNKITVTDKYTAATASAAESYTITSIKLESTQLITVKITDYEVTECASIIPCFGIDNNIYNQLVARYSNPDHPLTFPTQTISFFTTTQPLRQPQDKSTITVTPRFVDSIFCLFPLKHTHHTYFKNPLFTHFQLNAGGYGNIPVKAFGTTGTDPEFIEYCQNAMNVNGDQNGFNKEVIASLCNTEKYNQNITGYYSNDRSSFFIGFATETDGTYQQGLTSLSPINFEILCSQDTSTGSFAKEVQTPPILCLLYDVSISILVQPNGIPPLVRLGAYDLTTPEE